MNPARESIAVETFGPYEVYERLGMGGMASVHRAKKRGPAGFERTVALKRMLSHLTEDRGFIESFVREAKVASMLAHPNIAQTFDFGRINGVFYIAMELVSGYDVRKLLRHAHRANEPIPLPVVLQILGELCEALDFAHSFVDENGQQMHIVHRDISPSNMIVAHTGHLKVIDFGIAKANSRQLHTESGLVKGKLGYMAPEVALGMPIGPVSDIFSMGVVAWELVTALPLFSARTDFETMRKLREEPVAPASSHNPTCPPMLDHLIFAALERDPDRRIQSARAFRSTIDSIAAQYGIQMSARAVADWTKNFVGASETRASIAVAPMAGASGQMTLSEKLRKSSVTASQQSRPRTPSGRALPLPPPGPETMIQRPSTAGPQLRRSDEDIQLATEIWGEDATAAPQDSGNDFSVASPHSTTGPEPLPLTPLGLSVPSLASASSAAMMPTSQVHALSAHGTGQQPPAQSSRGSSKTVIAVVAGLFVVAGVLGGILYAKKSDEPTAAAAPVSTNATVKFVIEPETAVVEIGGKALGAGAHETELAPGVYSISIKHDGYKTWTGAITLAQNDKQSINVALEREVVAVAQPDPVPVPDPQPPKPDPATGDDDDDDDNKSSTKTGTKRPRPDKNDKRPDRGSSNNVTVAPTPDPDPPKPDPVVTKPDPVPPKPDPVVTKPDPIPPKPDPITPPPDTKPKTTPVVAPSAVTKVSGDVPTLRSKSGDTGNVTAKMCIDEGGRVTSVKLIKGPPDISADLQRALMTWRYKPYTNRDQKVSPVCFPLSIRVVLKP